MSKIDYKWVRAQFEKAHVKIGPGETVLALLKEWEKHDLDSTQLQQEAVDIFSQVALGHALVPDVDEVWVEVIPGALVVGNEVRVKADAYAGELGRLHNGRRGKVVAIRFGDVIFNSTDDMEPKLESVHYSPYNLELRIK